jgi:hypothetical protein
MASSARIVVQGTLLAQGTAAAPIVFTSAAAQPQPGDWQYIAIDGAGASGSRLEHVEVFYGAWNGGAYGMLTITGGANPAIGDSVFAQATRDGIWADDKSRPTISNCIFSGDTGFAVSVPADGAALVTGTALGPNQGGIEVYEGIITHPGVWHKQDAPFVLGYATLAAGVSLSIEPGLLIEMASSARMVVQGKLLAQGTAAAPIVVTSAAPHPKPGDWQFIDIDGPATAGTSLDYVQVSYGSWNGGAYGAISVTGRADPAITHCLVSQSVKGGIWVADDSRATIAYCAFRDDGGPAVSIPKGARATVHDNSFAPGQSGLESRG